MIVTKPILSTELDQTFRCGDRFIARLQENPQNISFIDLWQFWKNPQKVRKRPLFQSRNEVENFRNVPENIDEDDHDENQENVAFDENTW